MQCTQGAADLAIVHVNDVVEAHAKCMTDDAAKGRYLVAGDMVQIEEGFSSLKQMYPQLNVAALEEQRRVAAELVTEACRKSPRPQTRLLVDTYGHPLPLAHRKVWSRSPEPPRAPTTQTGVRRTVLLW